MSAQNYLQPLRPRFRGRAQSLARVRSPDHEPGHQQHARRRRVSTARCPKLGDRSTAGFGKPSVTSAATTASIPKTGNLRLPRLRDAVGPSFIGANGVPQCGTAARSHCQLRAVSICSAARVRSRGSRVEYLTYTGVQHGYNQSMGGQFNTSGELFHLAAESAVGLALGYGMRQVSGGQIPDPVTVAGETSGNKLLITEGKYSVHEGVTGELVDSHHRQAAAAPRALEGHRGGARVLLRQLRLDVQLESSAVAGAPVARSHACAAPIRRRFRAPEHPELLSRRRRQLSRRCSDPCASPTHRPQLARLGRNCGAALRQRRRSHASCRRRWAATTASGLKRQDLHRGRASFSRAG